MINCIQHKDLNFSLLKSICFIKDDSWNHGLQNQMNWIESNIQKNDYHVLLSEGKELIGYVNLVYRSVIIENKKYSILGLGNVCLSNSHKGIGVGSTLMKEVNLLLVNMNYNGILHCKYNLVPFYKKFGWSILESNNFSADYSLENIYTMVLKVDGLLGSDIKLIGKSF